MSSADEFLMGGGVPSAKFPTPGTTVTGVIVTISEPRQQRDLATGTPKVWDDGSPMMQLPVHLLTEQRDLEIADDEGLRAVYIKGQMIKAVRDAVRAAGAKGLEVGGTLTVTYVRDGEKKRGLNAPKEYSVTYASPGAAAAGEFLGTNGQTTAAPAAAPAAQPPAGVAPDPVATARSLLAIGTPAASVAEVTGLDMTVIAALQQLATAS